MRKPPYFASKAFILALSIPFIRPASAQSTPVDLDPDFGFSTMPLWEGGAPGSLGTASEDRPSLTVFPPQRTKGNGAAVLVVPGGGYMGRASNIEGRQVADWYCSRGFTAFVLKYRLGAKYLYPIPLNDASRAIRVVRSLSAKLKFDPTRIGMIGFSAGGHLAAMLGTTADGGDMNAKDPVDRLSSRPDFIVLGYPWLNAMQPSHPGGTPSYQTLTKVPQEQQADYVQPYTPLFHVTPNVPPTFIFITSDDPTVSVQSTVDYYEALRAAGVPAEMHIFAHGPHGVGLGSGDPALDLWPMLMEAWLRGLRVMR